MRTLLTGTIPAVLMLAATSGLAAQSPDLYSGMHWRQIGPLRGGRGRSVIGVPSQPNLFYIGFDNGGVWRTTDYGATWEPIFDRESTGSIGAIAVAPSDPNIIYVGSGAGIIRPDLAIGNGIYKSTDAGKSWSHLGLFDSQMIAMIDVDPRDPNRLFVAVLGHPYGPNAERGVFRSTDGGKSFEKVLYKDEYTSANDVRIDPSEPNVVYATLWEQQQSFIEGRGFGGAGTGLFKSIDGGTTWKPLSEGLPPVLQANLALVPSNPKVLYAIVAPAAASGGSPGPIGIYKSTDAGEHWYLAVRGPNPAAGATQRASDPRPLARIGGGDLPTLTVDPKNENVVYSASVVMWRTEDGGMTWSAVRGAPGGDDYQRIWINPDNPNIIASIADQGAVISANRGKSWSNWYTQPAAAMFHVTADNAFPYRLCAGQQDAGSACVDSRSMDGQITFHDWHPANIQEYGIAAPDPRDPDMVYGSSRNTVTLYNRQTGQTTQVGPDMSARGPNGEVYNRNVRTMPLHWSPVNPDLLFYTSNAVWKTMDRGHSWTRISPDLSRQTWAVPANAGKYAASVTPSPLGVITALSPSPRSAAVLWAGTDDGNIQVTLNGGMTWSNVTPAGIKPWTRIFNIEAGHFDTQTAYAAANTLRVDDPNPHFWRTRDGGKTWTEITSGMAPGAAANSIREDPRIRGLLYAATETQVWVSFDDGEQWRSLRLDMPAISIRDIRVKDDSTCLCADLVAGTHGRGFWILDNLTPLRQAAEAARAKASNAAYLFRPATAVRVRFATNDPTPWPPEIPAGENPPPGAILDYYLSAATPGPVKLEILDTKGDLVRAYSSEDRAAPDPARDPEGYNRRCQETPSAPYCGTPLYWPAPAMLVSKDAGMHRFSWDMRYAPVTEDVPGGVIATGAVPRRSYPQTNAPWAPPGRYTVRLTVNGVSQTQPLTLVLDPRVRIPRAALVQLNALSEEMYRGAKAAQAAYTEARALAAALEKVPGAEVDAFRARVDSLAPAPRPQQGFGGFGGGGAPQGPPTLSGTSAAMLAAAMAMQRAEVQPTASQIAAAHRAREQWAAVLSRWTSLKTTGLGALNAKRKAAGLPVVVPQE